MQLNHSCKRIFHIPHFKKIPICVYALAFLVLSQKSESSTVKSTKVTFKSRVKSPTLSVKIRIYAPYLTLTFFCVLAFLPLILRSRFLRCRFFCASSCLTLPCYCVRDHFRSRFFFNPAFQSHIACIPICLMSHYHVHSFALQNFSISVQQDSKYLSTFKSNRSGFHTLLL